MRYSKPKAGEWVQPIPEGYKLGCCDCGLVHKMDFRLAEGRIQFRVFRDDRATAQKRRHSKIKLVAKVPAATEQEMDYVEAC